MESRAMQAKWIFAFVGGVFSTLLGAIVILGWILRIDEIVQIHPTYTPMNFNTALCFFFTGLTLIALSFSSKVGLRFLSILLAFFSGLALMEYAFSVDLRVDQLFLTSHIATGVSHLGRMAPHTAFCFFLMGLALFLVTFKDRYIVTHTLSGNLTIFVFYISSFSLFGYIFHFDPIIGWGGFSRMALHTSFGFLFASVTFGLHLICSYQKWSEFRSLIFPFLATLVLLLISVALWMVSLVYEKEKILEIVQARNERLIFQVSSSLDERAKGLRRMAKRWQYLNGNREEFWRADALAFHGDFPGLFGLGYVDSSGQVKWMEPEEKNKMVFGFIPSTEPHRKAALEMARETNGLALTKTLDLVQGGRGFLMIYPVFKKSQVFDGYLYAVINTDTFFTQITKSDDYDIEVQEDGSIIYGSSSMDPSLQQWGVSSDLNWNDLEWRVKSIPTLAGLRQSGSLVPTVVLLVGFLFSSLVSLLTRLYYVANEEKKRADQASEAKSRFLASMSHEIRTPLNAITGFAELLTSKTPSDQQTEYIESIKSSSQALLSLINDILDFSKIESGKLDLEVLSFNLKQLISESLSIVGHEAKLKGLRLREEYDSSLPVWIKGDPSRIRQVLLNIMGNAVKFTEDGEVSVRVQKKIEKTQAYVHFEVEDTGIGISADDQLALFSPFEQGESSINRRFGGTGLGLSVSHELVTAMNGQIGFESQEGKGSVFWFQIPLIAGQKVDGFSEPATDAGFSENHRILVVEDNIMNQKIALAALRKLGIRAQAVGNGKEALEILEEINFDLVFMDCFMPVMDGYEATQRIRAHRDQRVRATPVVAMTANALKNEREKCLAIGMNDYISKPIDPHKFLKILSKWLNSKKT